MMISYRQRAFMRRHHVDRPFR